MAMRTAELFTAVYSPRDTTKTWPILMKRTPAAAGRTASDKMADKIGPSEEKR